MCMQEEMLWTSQLHEMRRYRAIHGTAYVPLKWEDPTGDFNNHLAKWVHQQPTLFAQRRLTLEQVGPADVEHLRLQQGGGWWLGRAACKS